MLQGIFCYIDLNWERIMGRLKKLYLKVGKVRYLKKMDVPR